MTTSTTAYAVYQLITTAKNVNYRKKYEGTNLVEALNAYDKLVAKNLPRVMNKNDGGVWLREMEGDLPEGAL